MELVPYFGAVLGFFGGFLLGLSALTYITRGMKKREMLQDKDKKIWLGLLGWFFALVGCWAGWQLGHYLTYLLQN